MPAIQLTAAQVLTPEVVAEIMPLVDLRHLVVRQASAHQDGVRCIAVKVSDFKRRTVPMANRRGFCC